MSRKPFFAWVLGALAVLSVGCGKEASAPMAPDVSFTSLETSKRSSLSDFKGKVVLIDMWATWCGPCRETMPIIERMHKQYESKGLEVVAVTSENEATVKEFLKDFPMEHPIYLDLDSSLHNAFGSTAIPDSVVVGKDGKILYRGHPGYEDELEGAIKAGLGL